MRLTEATELSTAFVDRVRPSLDAVTGHDYFRLAAASSLTLPQCRKGLLGFYPLIVAFPRYMGHTLERLDARAAPRADEARRWLAKNLRTEARHAKWWVHWGRAFGIDEAEFAHARATAAMDAPNRYLDRVAREGSSVEAVAAVNYALEGATGVWTRETLAGLSRQSEKHGYRADGRALRWLTAHAAYDEKHPVEALEVVKVLATDAATVEKAALAAVESLGYLGAALDDSLAA